MSPVVVGTVAFLLTAAAVAVGIGLLTAAFPRPTTGLGVGGDGSTVGVTDESAAVGLARTVALVTGAVGAVVGLYAVGRAARR